MAPHPSVLGGIPFDHLSAVSSNIYSAPMEVTQSAFQTAQALLGLSRQSVPGESQAEVLPAYEAEQIQGALALLQKQQVSQPVTPADDSDLRTRVMQALRSRHGYAEKKAIPEHEEGRHRHDQPARRIHYLGRTGHRRPQAQASALGGSSA